MRTVTASLRCACTPAPPHVAYPATSVRIITCDKLRGKGGGRIRGRGPHQPAALTIFRRQTSIVAACGSSVLPRVSRNWICLWFLMFSLEGGGGGIRNKVGIFKNKTPEPLRDERTHTHTTFQDQKASSILRMGSLRVVLPVADACEIAQKPKSGRLGGEKRGGMYQDRHLWCRGLTVTWFRRSSLGTGGERHPCVHSCNATWVLKIPFSFPEPRPD